ncbi:acetyl-CoA carboxylase carboxyl transferase subunit alpha [Helicobacter heilmannii]|uniref:Acetyl-coenzyme A carboxylase carboxyl transferase subunit alpha n=1 Tax=Helicobacter heilmannii TaxID=35817 RepID=A0A0K2XJE8_HELHE|nr:acetyl-CoA carboxylase carboxyl transferase subunit alpha [Helicobacter heilmannii]CCM12003.1 Acetyl-coenzyme A carboxyl transferase alpha chain [Helicobacter heilmannii ASB1.4]CRF46227.1 Acetyl-coenzyme A carboxyl transferase alpha chain [Helicobacter heilmannii]CRF47397.1 Acetyl-coenzyme A carboxyl transferase alpha chain [Helicobacter heilmannii]CRF48479.1 Acetyl-coenzyme A carboxyl transferase alpha chain [Helicobacter heilmannii]CRF51352.1 Acetyl-coenzyme A carboxyl transferase alpha c
MAVYLDFENRIKGLQEDIEMAAIRGDLDAQEILQKRLAKETNAIYSNLSDYQRLQLARHPDRPYAMDYIDLILTNRYELFGDRHFKDDKAIVCFVGKIEGVPVVVIAEEKGRGTKNKIMRNFGMPNPEGYRKALKSAKFAEKFNLPILMLVDTAGAYPGLGAEERGQSEAIARNLQEFAALKVPTISIIIGEGGSGGALAIAVADRLAMMEYAVFSVISPEGCAAILWNDPSKIEVAIKAMKITPFDLKKANLIDDIILEPERGAHRDKLQASQSIKDYFLQQLPLIQQSDFLTLRYEKLMSFGAFA